MERIRDVRGRATVSAGLTDARHALPPAERAALARGEPVLWRDAAQQHRRAGCTRSAPCAPAVRSSAPSTSPSRRPICARTSGGPSRDGDHDAGARGDDDADDVAGGRLAGRRPRSRGSSRRPGGWRRAICGARSRPAPARRAGRADARAEQDARPTGGGRAQRCRRRRASDSTRWSNSATPSG